MTGSDAAALAAATTDAYPSTIPTRITTSGSSTAAASSATSATCAAATAFGQRGTYRQSRDCENQHEHSESFHVAPPSWDDLDYPSIIGVGLLTGVKRLGG